LEVDLKPFLGESICSLLNSFIEWSFLILFVRLMLLPSTSGFVVLFLRICFVGTLILLTVNFKF
jgi:hypothetical protein